MFYSKGGVTLILAPLTGIICQGKFEIVPSGSQMVDMGISSNIMKSPPPKCYMTFRDMIIYSDALNMIRHFTNMGTYYRTGPYYRFWPYYKILGAFHRTLHWVRLANRGRLLLRTPGPVPLGTCICSNIDTVFGLRISSISRYFHFAFDTETNAFLITIYW